MAIPITALYGAGNALFNVFLAANVTILRGKTKVFLGHGDSPQLLLAARRHGNNAEYLALALLMMWFVEVSGGSHGVLHGLGAALTAGRLAHAVGVGATPSPARAVGALLTWLSIAGAAIYVVVLAVR